MSAAKYYEVLGSKPNVLYINTFSNGLVIFIIMKIKDKYFILHFKKNKIFTRDYIASLLLNKSAEETIKYLINQARFSKLLKYFKEVDLRSFTLQLISEESFHLKFIKTWFPEIIDIINQESENIDNFKVFFGNFSELVRSRARYFITKAAKLVRDNNLLELLYGHIFMVKHIAMRPPASYNSEEDLIKIAWKTTYTKNYKEASVKNVLHELGHRALSQEFINQEAIKKQYIKIKKEQNTKWIPSKYSLKDEKEWFSEIFAYGILQNNLEYKELIRKVWS